MFEYFASLRHNVRSRLGQAQNDDQPPLRAELFSVEQMEQHGRTLAGQHELGLFRQDRLLTRLDENERADSHPRPFKRRNKIERAYRAGC